VASIIATFCISRISEASGIQAWSIATAFTSTALLGGALSVGPIAVLQRRPNPVSSDLRRDLGIWTALLALIHVALGLQVHFGDPLKYFMDTATDGTMNLRFDAVGITNYAGLAATLVVIVLLAISSDAALRFLGTGNWKSIQRSTYWLAALVVLHGALYEVIEARRLALVLLFAAIATVVVVLQLSARSIRRRARP
jgi:sulfoxide reductase heme-binding subunit YedZ